MSPNPCRPRDLESGSLPMTLRETDRSGWSYAVMFWVFSSCKWVWKKRRRRRRRRRKRSTRNISTEAQAAIVAAARMSAAGGGESTAQPPAPLIHSLSFLPQKWTSACSGPRTARFWGLGGGHWHTLALCQWSCQIALEFLEVLAKSPAGLAAAVSVLNQMSWMWLSALFISIYLVTFWPHCLACGILVPWWGMGSVLLALEARNLNR